MFYVPVMAKDVQMGFRISAGERAAVEELIRRRHAETGDDSASGWFRALVRREANEAGVRVEPGKLPPRMRRTTR